MVRLLMKLNVMHLENAVEQAVGTMVDSTTLVKNNMLINDEIYTQSRGYITNYTILSKRLKCRWNV